MVARRFDWGWWLVFPHILGVYWEQQLTLKQVIRGNSVVMLEALERIGGGREDRG